MLSIQEFRFLPFEKKCDQVTYRGQYLAFRRLGDCKVFLYYSDSFFIEVYYSTKYQKVLMINAFEGQRGLEPYLDKISLADLYSRPLM
ncbi:MAG: hypothetical protein KF845_02270 [Cyclobacteriaceae bacterium]|nr:hypothetical protein [Cyclobacteriaceae bacterium]